MSNLRDQQTLFHFSETVNFSFGNENGKIMSNFAYYNFNAQANVWLYDTGL